MAFTLSNLLEQAYATLGQLTYSVATGGTGNTVVDSYQDQATTKSKTGDNKLGFLVITYDSAGASAAPEGQYGQITAFDNTTGAFTLRDSFTSGSAASGDKYAFASEYFPIHTMERLASLALQNLGDIELVDTTTITSASGQTEYTIPVGLKRGIWRVDVQTYDDSDDNQWARLDDWTYVPATAGTAASLQFKDGLTDGMSIRVWYHGVHPILTAYSSPVVETLEPRLAVAAMVYEALNWQVQRTMGQDKNLSAQLDMARQKLEYLKTELLPRRKRRNTHVLVFGDAYHRDRYGNIVRDNS